MKLLLVLLALLLGWLFGGVLRNLKHRLVASWYGLLMKPDSAVWWPIGLALIPGLLTAALWFFLEDQGQYLLAALWSLAALVFAWGSRDLDADVARYLQAEDDAAREAAGARFVFSYRHADAAGACQAGMVEGVFYEGLVRWFGTLFWFLLAGPGGAVSYRFLQILLGDEENRSRASEPQIGLLRRFVALVNWPPAVLASAALAVVGDFDRVLRSSRELVAEHGWLNLDRDVWPRLGALTARSVRDEAFSHEFSGELGQVDMAMNLVWRVLVSWLTVVALVTVGFALA
ncbi:MAG: hypothetical protein AAGA23_11550 [Pseudomonadota bacterium]